MTKIFYFSGTGNSLHLANQLSEQIEDSVALSIVSRLSQRTEESLSGSVGFVFPVHAFSMPGAVKEFIKSLTFDKDTYIFAIATRMGSACRVFEDMDIILGEKGAGLSAKWFVNMPNNYLTLLPLSDEKEAKKLNLEAEDELSKIAETIKEKRISHEKDPHYSFIETNVLFPILSKVYNKTNYFGLENKFYADETCSGCSLCSNLCLSSKIVMNDGKPVWQKDVKCYHCLGCIHYCPKKAIQINKKTKKADRYHHPQISAKQIGKQKVN